MQSPFGLIIHHFTLANMFLLSSEFLISLSALFIIYYKLGLDKGLWEMHTSGVYYGNYL